MAHTSAPQNNKVNLLTQALERTGIQTGDSLEEMASKFISYFPPRYVEVERTDAKCVLAITTCPDASLLSCIINGDENFLKYSHPDGMEHSLIRIGNNALVVADFLPGESLYSIETVKFLRIVPLGATVHISLTRQGKSACGRFNKSQMKGWILEDGKPLFAPSTILTIDLEA